MAQLISFLYVILIYIFRIGLIVGNIDYLTEYPVKTGDISIIRYHASNHIWSQYPT
jgi:hypothetical protein